ncbi:hypothetical protein [Neptunicella sp.]|uniref:hypothetical protein n=1 Tax=Neptunicella sp. TaxID=2125986 RepID=UPI003F6929D3
MSGVIDVRKQAEDDLAQWGLFSRENYLPVCKCQRLDIKRDVALDRNGNPLVITADYAYMIDASVADMVHLDPLYPKIARMYFVAGFSYRDISNLLPKLNKDKVSSIIGEIVVWVARDAVRIAA